MERKRGHYDKFDIDFKLKIISEAEQTNNRQAARKYKIDETQIRRWRKQKVQLKHVKSSVGSKRKRLSGAGSQPKYPGMEIALVEWVREQRLEYHQVTTKMVQEKAQSIQEESGNSNFIASRGWLCRFFKRNNLSLRRRTTTGQKLPKDLMPKIQTFLLGIRNKVRELHINLKNIGGMDETPVFIDMPGNTIVDEIGQQTVPIVTTGHEHDRFTVALAAMANGKKLKPFVIFRGQRMAEEVLFNITVVFKQSKILI